MKEYETEEKRYDKKMIKLEEMSAWMIMSKIRTLASILNEKQHPDIFNIFVDISHHLR